MLKKSLLDSFKKAMLKRVVRRNKVKTTDKIQQRDHSSFTNEEVEKPVQNYENRQRKNQLSKDHMVQRHHCTICLHLQWKWQSWE